MAQICKFYGVGQCRFGQSCRFIHPGETTVASSTGSTGFGNNTFGNARHASEITQPIFSYENYFRDLGKTPGRLMYFFCSFTGFSDGVAQAKLGDRLVFSVDQSQHWSIAPYFLQRRSARTEISTSMRPLSHHAPNLPFSPALCMAGLTVTILISFRSASTYQRKTPFE